MRLVKLWEKIGKQPLRISQYTDVIIETEKDKFFVDKINYRNGKFVSLNAEKICCKTCKNYPQYNNGYAPPHTCDICTSLEEEEDYSMWELYKE
jgi:hypothetical protein